MRKAWAVVAAAVVAVVLMVAGVAWWLDGDSGTSNDTDDTAQPRAELVSEPQPLKLGGRTTLRRDPTYFGCDRPAKRPFVPTSISVQGVTKSAKVLALARDSRGVPGVPPISTVSKLDFAFDVPGIHPGEASGNVLMNAHTWPDGTAMGNHLLRSLQEGDRLTLHGKPGVGVCYEVNDRVEYGVYDAPLERVYDTDGPPQVVIIVCSGTRLGPGDWTHRTIWFASPI